MAGSFDDTWAIGDVLPAAELNKVALIKLADSTLSVAAVSIDLQNIPQGYTHLQLVTSLRSDQSASVTFQLLVNNDSGSNYDRFVNGSIGALQTEALLTSIGTGVQSDAAAGSFGMTDLLIARYTDTGEWRVGHGEYTAGRYDDTGNGASVRVGFAWRNTADAINRLTIFPSTGNLDAGSRVSLYGLKT